MRWLVYMRQTCGTSVEDVHKMTVDAMESSDNPALMAVNVEGIDSVAVTQTIGEQRLHKNWWFEIIIIM